MVHATCVSGPIRTDCPDISVKYVVRFSLRYSSTVREPAKGITEGCTLESMKRFFRIAVHNVMYCGLGLVLV